MQFLTFGNKMIIIIRFCQIKKPGVFIPWLLADKNLILESDIGVSPAVRFLEDHGPKIIDNILAAGHEHALALETAARSVNRQIKRKYHFAHFFHPTGNVCVFAIKNEFRIKTADHFETMAADYEISSLQNRSAL
jgi:hypothetical protein